MSVLKQIQVVAGAIRFLKESHAAPEPQAANHCPKVLYELIKERR